MLGVWIAGWTTIYICDKAFTWSPMDWWHRDGLESALHIYGKRFISSNMCHCFDHKFNRELFNVSFGRDFISRLECRVWCRVQCHPSRDAHLSSHQIWITSQPMSRRMRRPLNEIQSMLSIISIYNLRLYSTLFLIIEN